MNVMLRIGSTTHAATIVPARLDDPTSTAISMMLFVPCHGRGESEIGRCTHIWNFDKVILAAEGTQHVLRLRHAG